MEIIPAQTGTPMKSSRAALDYDDLVDLTLSTMQESSRRVYASTYLRWVDWCDAHALDPLMALTAQTVETFLIDQDITRTTRERYLAALRKLGETVGLFDRSPERQVTLELLRLLHVPTARASDTERAQVALTPEQSRVAIQVWRGPRARDKRNRALIAVLLLTGMRRSEAAALTWADIDLDAGVISVRHGKGNKHREVALYGTVAVDVLRAWRAVQGPARTAVFCHVNKADTLGPDRPISPQSIYRVVKETEQRAGLDHFSPHDARRTLITELLNTGSPVHEVQDQAGHADGKMTLRYARASSARKRRKSGVVRYG